MKRRQSIAKDPEEETLNIGEAIVREVSCYASIWKMKPLTYVEAKRLKLAGKDLGSVVESMGKTVSKLDEIYHTIKALRNEHTKSMVSVVQWAEEKRSEGSNSYTSGESDR